MQVAPDVSRHVVDRCITPLRLLPEGDEDNRVEVATELAAKNLLRADAGWFRDRRPHRVGDVERVAAACPVRRTAGEQLVQHDTQRVDVTGGGSRLPGDLFWTRVFRREE